MVFSSPIFLFAFLPLVALAYFLVGKRGRNGFLLAASLFFYAWGEPVFVGLLVLSIAANYGMGLWIGRTRLQSRIPVACGIALNVGVLVAFKYLGFVLDSFALGSAINGAFPAMPIGISFYTFQAISYLVDVYRNECPPQHSPWRLGLYIAMFPQLIAGPIVRYSEIGEQIDQRSLSLLGVREGLQRFVVGLAKKILIADTLAPVADACFDGNIASLPTTAAWIGLLAFALQIFFDFSGYSDMAIGLGRLFGFRYPENFDNPYLAQSIREFWRRWHMTLSRWFKDYLYIPLGGNRRSHLRVGINLLLVFALCGLWHGASAAFLAWGLWHGAFLALERGWLGRFLGWAPSVLGWVYTLAVALLSWVFFRCNTLPEAVIYFQRLFHLGAEGRPEAEPLHLWHFPILLAFAAGIILASGFAGRFGLRIACVASALGRTRRGLIELGTLALFVACLIRVAADSYSPFLYFRF